MVINRRGFNFSAGKFKRYPGRGMVYRLADHFDSGRRLYAEKEKRRQLLRLDEEKRGRKEVESKIKNNPRNRGLFFI